MNFFLSFEKLCFTIFMIPYYYINTLLLPLPWSWRKFAIFWNICKDTSIYGEKGVNTFKKNYFLSPYSFFFFSIILWILFYENLYGRLLGTLDISTKKYKLLDLYLSEISLEKLLQFVFLLFASSLISIIIKYLFKINFTLLLSFWAYFYPFYYFEALSWDFLFKKRFLFKQMYPHFINSNLLDMVSIIVFVIFSICFICSPLLFISSISPSFFWANCKKNKITKILCWGSKKIMIILAPVFIVIVIAGSNLIFQETARLLTIASVLVPFKIIDDMKERVTLIKNSKDYCRACDFSNFAKHKTDTENPVDNLLALLNDKGKTDNKIIYHIANATRHACAAYSKQLCSENNFNHQIKSTSDKFIYKVFNVWIYMYIFKTFCEDINLQDKKVEEACKEFRYTKDFFSFRHICVTNIPPNESIANACKTLELAKDPTMINAYIYLDSTYIRDMYNVDIPKYERFVSGYNRDSEVEREVFKHLEISKKHFQVVDNLMKKIDFWDY